MSDKARPGRSKHPATRRYAEAMQELEDAGSGAVVPIREYVRQMRTEASKYRLMVRSLKQELKEARHDD
ncbi:hypothetical protein [Brevibacterium aurantiacum]|uniref:hypothetical protein n=1 Tax=Brevibacterium aurantiacum TaxID=273384 RepID=UPI000BB6F6EF|nr:hypothetical protein [Brevibacterium aurantiacum]PCC58650.1 hypothetical protein CIK58_01545 [Brevibacterium aurantiacum]